MKTNVSKKVRNIIMKLSKNFLKIKYCPTFDIDTPEFECLKSSQFTSIKESLKRFGLLRPLVINKLTGNVVGGRVILMAMRALAIEGHKQFEMAPFIEVSLSPSEEKELRKILNS